MTDNQRKKIAAAAFGELGVKEASGANDGIPYTRYAMSTVYASGKKPPWCAAFVVWCYNKAGFRMGGKEGRRKLFSVAALRHYIATEGQFTLAKHVAIWHKLDVATTVPDVGDIIFFKSRGDSDTGTGKHCGIVEFLANGTVHTIEGNKGNAVGRGAYKLDNPRIWGYGNL